MGKKVTRSRVIATAVIHLCEDGTYCMSTPLGWERKDLVRLDWKMLRLAMRDLQVEPASAAQSLDAAMQDYAEKTAAPYRKLDELGAHIRAAWGDSLEKKLSIPTSSAHSYNGVPFVPPMAPVLNPEAYEKSPPYWIPSSPQRLHLIELTHVQARRLQLPAPTYPDLEALLNPFTSPVHAALNEHIRRLYQLDPILSRP